ncbi:GL13564 [Drosophila persimilis]|uniref:Esterase GA18864 n=3 Tax=pseudoobscura subgroup TaxID=32358 RepID=LOVG_DROPS|nr:esterase GA18864 [Drosophila persimilis]Q29BR3.1 RecName: Full=Esterase GA18864 [Drosophila pseudoobscura pseudoobscura]EDW39145.1 GL13564 [Drosophila persimilis]
MTNNDAAVEAPSSSRASSSKQQPKLEITEKVRVLCLHGYRQDGDAFKNKLGSFRKFTSKYAEFVFISAPHIAAPLESAAEPVPEQRSWWANKDDGTFKGTNKGGPAFGFQDSLRLVEEAWKTQGPFQGLLGFSQGACFVGLICGLAKKKLTSIRPEFAVLSSGFVSGSLVHMSAYEEPVSIPTLHIYGSSDEIIPKDMSALLASHFKNVEVLEHGGGHYFPATAQQKQTYINFFQDRLQEYLEHLELQQSSSVSFIESGAEDNDDDGDANDAEVAAATAAAGSDLDDSD